MKYIFKNIGPIKNAELELGDLTVIAGANNTGKTYIAYTLYGLQKYIRHSVALFMQQIEKSYGKKFSDTKNAGGIVKGSVPSSVLVQCVQEYIEHSAKLFPKEKLAEVFAAQKEDFSQSSVEIVTKKINIPKGFSISGTAGSTKINLSEKNGKIEYEVKFDTDIQRLVVGLSDSNRLFAHNFIIHAILSEVFGITPNFVLPAERFNLSIFYRDLDYAKTHRHDSSMQKWDSKDMKRRLLSRTRFMSRKGGDRYGIPIRDHIDWTRDLDQFTKQKSALSEYILFDNIRRMMDGYYRHNGDEIFFVFRTREKNLDKARLHLASSSVRGLSSLYFYLKHGADPNDLIIVDEPESHLDTKNQIKMARLLAQCVNSGLRVLITTHSDYIVQELNNMIMLHSAPKNEKIRQLCKKQGYNKHHFLDKSKVKGYLCKDGGLEHCKIDDRGMNLQWFDETIKNINNVSDILDSHLPDEE